MASTWGSKVKISIFGESHGNGIGVVVDGIPAGFAIDKEQVIAQMSRRAPGKDPTATPRKEDDTPEILSGLLDDVTTGAPICAVIRNTNTKSEDYNNLLVNPRPGHSDYTAFIKYQGHNDIRGGGHFSGRLTAPLVFAGAICRQILLTKNIKIAAHISSIMDINDTPFNGTNVTDELIERLNHSSFALVNDAVEIAMRSVITQAKQKNDSVGGVIECIITGLEAGLGDPMFDGIESVISSIVFGIPAVKGIEFGKGFALTRLYGSQSNDAYQYRNGKVETETNNCGGILGGISNGMPIVFRAAVKPTPSIGQTQRTVDLTKKTETEINVNGRHDPCIVPRAVPVVEAAAAVAVLNLLS